MTKHDFLAYLVPFAVQLRAEGSPMFPSVRLAQNLLETGGVIHGWYNLGGIKVGKGKPNPWWDGSSVNKTTWEVYNGVRVNTPANFRAYASVYCFYKDQDLLFNNTRYARVRAAKTPQEQATALYQCGYATDPQYTGKLMTIIQAYGLTKYDKEDEYMLKAEDANKVIALLGAVWQLTDTPATTNEGQREATRLANELRKASGQEVK